MNKSPLASILWELLSKKQVQGLNTGGSAGHQFEDITVETVYNTTCREASTLKPFLPRYTLPLPTASGLPHQIDVVVRERSYVYHLIECKFKQSVNIEELYALNAKLLDYAFGAQVREQKTRFRGYFFTTYPKVNENFLRYALAWGIVLIAPGCPPPLEHLLANTTPDTPLYNQLIRLVRKTSGTQLGEFATKPREASRLLSEWNACHRQWERCGLWYTRLTVQFVESLVWNT